MKRTTGLLAFLVTACLVLTAAADVPTRLVSSQQTDDARAQDSTDRRECSQATLEGEYLFTGRADSPEYVHVATFPRIFVGVYTFDGKGNVAALATQSRGGEIRRRVTPMGMYTLDADCNGTITFGGAEASNWDLFVTRKGDEGHFIRFDEGTIATRSFTRR